MKDNLILETIKKFPLEDIEQFVENLLDKNLFRKTLLLVILSPNAIYLWTPEAVLR